MENTRDIYSSLEKAYEQQNGRKLTLERAGEVMPEPRHPDSAGRSPQDMQSSPSSLLSQELKKLNRLRYLVHNEYLK